MEVEGGVSGTDEVGGVRPLGGVHRLPVGLQAILLRPTHVTSRQSGATQTVMTRETEFEGRNPFYLLHYFGQRRVDIIIQVEY